MVGCKPVTTPGAKDNIQGKDEELNVHLNESESTRYRRAAARVNYMALDRPDLSFASKETARGMAKPTVRDTMSLKRIIRYLQFAPEFSIWFRFQSRQHVITGFTDSDWAGCSKTRKSTSGGCVLIGNHFD